MSMDILDATIISSNFWPTIQVWWTILLLVLIVGKRHDDALGCVLTLLGEISKMRGHIYTLSTITHIFSTVSA